MKHKVKMLQSVLGCDDGVIYPVMYHEGAEHEIGTSLLEAFISTGAVELVADDAAEGTEPSEGKADDAADENKALHGAPENKAKAPKAPKAPKAAK